jgi:hypothetical protein
VVWWWREQLRSKASRRLLRPFPTGDLHSQRATGSGIGSLLAMGSRLIRGSAAALIATSGRSHSKLPSSAFIQHGACLFTVLSPCGDHDRRTINYVVVALRNGQMEKTARVNESFLANHKGYSECLRNMRTRALISTPQRSLTPGSKRAQRRRSHLITIQHDSFDLVMRYCAHRE